jgi:hypothetical protein
MIIRKAICKMIRAFPGGWSAMAAALGMSESSLENRVYERSGQRLHLDTALQIQTFSGTSLLAETLAKLAGGVFVLLPNVQDIDRTELLTEFNRFYADIGDLSRDFANFSSDGEITAAQFEVLEQDGERAIRDIQRALGLMHRLFERRLAIIPLEVPTCSSKTH